MSRKSKALVIEPEKEASFVVENLSKDANTNAVPNLKQEKLNLINTIVEPILGVSEKQDEGSNPKQADPEELKDKRFRLKKLMYRSGGKGLTEKMIDQMSEKELNQETELMRYRMTDRQNAAISAKALEITSYGVGYPLDIHEELKEEVANDKELQAIVNEKLTT